MVSRIFAVLAAVFLVVAIGIAALTSYSSALGQEIVALYPNGLVWGQGHSAAWVWEWVVRPFLIRPAWLLPACIGVVCAGIATTINMGRAAPSRRRRS